MVVLLAELLAEVVWVELLDVNSVSERTTQLPVHGLETLSQAVTERSCTDSKGTVAPVTVTVAAAPAVVAADSLVGDAPASECVVLCHAVACDASVAAANSGVDLVVVVVAAAAAVNGIPCPAMVRPTRFPRALVRRQFESSPSGRPRISYYVR